MRIMEGQGVDGHVDDESSPKRNAFVRVFDNVSLFSLLSSLFSSLFSLGRVLSCLVLSCGVCVGVRVCWRGGAILICKSFVVFGCWGDRQTEPSHSWFAPHFPS